MARVKVGPASKEVVHNEDMGGVKVSIQLYTQRRSEEIIISLSGPASWRGKLLPLVQRLFTDEDGKLVIMLPPSSEVVSLSPKNRAPGLYKLQSNTTGTFTFKVPDGVQEWVLGSRAPAES